MNNVYSFELFVYLYLYSLVSSVRLSGTVGFFFLFVVFTSFYYVFVIALYCVLPEWRNKHLYG